MFVTVGSLLHDVLDIDGRIAEALGGAAIYCGLTAKKLGMKSGVVSNVGSDYKYHNILEGIDTTGICIQGKTTVFFNTYRGQERTQRVAHIGKKLTASDFPEIFLDADAIHIGPVIDEIDTSLLAYIRKNSSALVTMDVQGFIRREENGNILHKQLDPRLLGYADIVHISQDDKMASQLPVLKRICPKILFTVGQKGSVLFWEGEEKIIPSFKANAIDPTGAGDVFTAAFVCRFLKTNDPEESARFASAAGSLCTEGVGIEGVPNQEQVLERMGY